MVKINMIDGHNVGLMHEPEALALYQNSELNAYLKAVLQALTRLFVTTKTTPKNNCATVSHGIHAHFKKILQRSGENRSASSLLAEISNNSSTKMAGKKYA